MPLSANTNMTSMPESITLSETYYNMEVINTLLNVDTSHPEYDLEDMMWPSEQAKLANIRKKSVNNVNIVTYKQASYDVGRRYPTPYKRSLQSMYNRIRRLVLGGKSTGLDIVNAHPTILKQTLEKFSPGFKKPHLDLYVNERRDTIHKVVETYDVTRKQAKGLFINMSFGGSYEVWFKSVKNRKSPSDMIVGYYREMQEIQAEIAKEKFPDFQKFIKIA